MEASEPEDGADELEEAEVIGGPRLPADEDAAPVVYVRQSTAQQVLVHRESTRLQYGLVDRARAPGWAPERVLVIDDDLGKSGANADDRLGFQRLVSPDLPSRTDSGGCSARTGRHRSSN